jgi:hypothetical protein
VVIITAQDYMLIFGAIHGGNKVGLFDKLKTVLSTVAPEAAGRVAPITEGKRKTQVKKPRVDSKKPEALLAPKPKKPRANSKKKVVEDPEKIKATKLGEPWVKVIDIELNPADPGQGAFELDWNDKFVATLVRSGYQGKTDQDIVDNWFQSICRNVVLETYEQEQADPDKRNASNRRDLGNGRTEVS